MKYYYPPKFEHLPGTGIDEHYMDLDFIYEDESYDDEELIELTPQNTNCERNTMSQTKNTQPQIKATYREPAYYYERRLCGINTYRTVVHHNGFVEKVIKCNTLEELKEKIDGKSFQEDHTSKRRPLKLEDLTMTFEKAY